MAVPLQGALVVAGKPVGHGPRPAARNQQPNRGEQLGQDGFGVRQFGEDRKDFLKLGGVDRFQRLWPCEQRFRGRAVRPDDLVLIEQEVDIFDLVQILRHGKAIHPKQLLRGNKHLLHAEHPFGNRAAHQNAVLRGVVAQH